MKIRIIAPSIFGIVFALASQAAAQGEPPPNAGAGASATVTVPSLGASPSADASATAATPSAGASATATSADQGTAPPPSEAPSKKPKPPYSIPWGLRGAVAGTSARIDAAIAMHDKGVTVPSVLALSYRIIPDLAFLGKISYAYDAQKNTKQVSAFYNPVFGFLYTPELTTGLRLPIFVGTNIPMGSGGGGHAATPEYRATTNAIYARGGLDNALYGVNFVTPMAGVGLAYIQHGLTAQIEGTLVYLKRTRGKDYEVDSNRWNSTAGAHLGYTILPALTASVELRYQRWLDQTAPSRGDTTKQDQFTGAVGLRTKIAFSDTIIARPGVAYIRGLDRPMSKGLLAEGNVDRAPFNIIFADIPVAF